MSTVYTNINKPSGTSYTNTNAVGKQQYDQADIMYDDANVFYDGIDESLYTNITKPTGIITFVGHTQGLLIPLTYRVSVLSSPYTFISKPN